MIREGMVDEGLSICRAIHERYHPEKRNPYNEVECGDFYARSMASWGVLLALSGYTHHSRRGALGFGPRVTPEDFRCAFTTAEGWGSFSQRIDGAAVRWEIRLVSGDLRLVSLEFDHLPRRVRGRPAIRLTSGGLIVGEASKARSSVRIEFPQQVVVKAGESLIVEMT